MNRYAVDTSEDNIRGPLASLKILYDGMPKTVGCEKCHEEWPDEPIWCCRSMNPSMYYVEFLYVWKQVQTWNKVDRVRIVLNAVRNYLNNQFGKPCVFWDEKCLVYEYRPFMCVDGDVFVLTDKGPKKIKHIFAGDFVMTHKGRFRRVRAASSRLTDNPKVSIRINGFGWSFMFTADHPFYSCLTEDKRESFASKMEWVAAEELVMKTAHSVGSYVMYPGLYFGQHPSTDLWVKHFVEGRVLNDRIYSLTGNDESNGIPCCWHVSDDFLWMLGLYLAEGSWSKSCVNFSLHINEKETIGRRLRSYMSSQGFDKPTETTRGSSYSVTYSSVMLGRFLSSLCGIGAANKRLHGDLFKMLSNKQLMKVFEGWKDGDGQASDQKSYKYRVTTISETLVMQMYFVLMSNGIASYVNRERRDLRYYASYNLVVHHSAFKPLQGQGTAYKWENQDLFRPVKFLEHTSNEDKPVFNLDVEDDESFVTAAGVVHNCRMYGVIPQESWDERIKSLKDQYGDNFPVRDQCHLVKVKDRKDITKEEENRWFAHVLGCEQRINVPKEAIEAHDKPMGSYRTFHDHLMLELFKDDFLVMLSEVRLKQNPTQDEIDAFVELLADTLHKEGVLE